MGAPFVMMTWIGHNHEIVAAMEMSSGDANNMLVALNVRREPADASSTIAATSRVVGKRFAEKQFKQLPVSLSYQC